MIGMAKKKSSEESASSSPKPNRRGKALHVWLEPKLRDAIDALAAKTRRSLTTEVSMALEKHLAEFDLWPLPEDD